MMGMGNIFPNRYLYELASETPGLDSCGKLTLVPSFTLTKPLETPFKVSHSYFLDLGECIPPRGC